MRDHTKERVSGGCLCRHGFLFRWILETMATNN